MKRRGRAALGAVGGILWGAGTAVLIQQYGLWPLDPLLAYGAPLAGALVSGAWGRTAGRRSTSAMLALLLVPSVVVAFQQDTCEAYLSGSSGEVLLSDTSPTDPFVLDPEHDGSVYVWVEGTGYAGREGEVWVEVGGIHILSETSTVSDSIEGEFDLADNGFGDLGGTPGIYRVGGSIDGACSVSGYVRITGSPWQGPAGPAGAGALLVGLGMTWVAGRPGGGGSTGGQRKGSLHPNGRPLQLDGVEIRSPGLEGDATMHEPSDATIRDVSHWTDDTREALAHHHMEPDQVIEIRNTAEATHAGGASGGAPPMVEPAIQVDLANPGTGKAQVIMATDESGVVTWHFPRLDTGGIDTMRHNQACRYFIRRAVPPATEPSQRRGLTEAFGTKVFTSLVFPLLDPEFERVGERFARVWETKRRPYRFRSFTPDDFDVDTAAEPDWDRLAGGRALLFVHGTFSRAHTGFGSLPAATVDDLHRLYEGRVFAFDHFTLSDDPKRNITWFYDHLPPGINLDIDIVCHSRGGLVSRILAERSEELAVGDRQVSVSKIVFAASPNAGTILAEPTYVGDLIDSYANLLNFVPGHHVVDVLEGVLTVIKHVAVGAVGGLHGLQAMRPGGEFLRWLNTTASNKARYFAVAGDYEPQLEGWRKLTVDRLMDRVFKEPNDLVVPTAGTYAANGSNHFPILNRHEFTGSDGVDHTGYFANQQVGADILRWLRQD